MKAEENQVRVQRSVVQITFLGPNDAEAEAYEARQIAKIAESGVRFPLGPVLIEAANYACLFAGIFQMMRVSVDSSAFAKQLARSGAHADDAAVAARLFFGEEVK